MGSEPFSSQTSRTTSQSVQPGKDARALWGLGEDLIFLNHGSFGAVPLELLEQATAFRRSLETNPVVGVWRQGLPAIRPAAEALSGFLGSEPDRTAFVANASAGMNAMLQSMPLEPGDEVLHVDQGYNAVWQTLVQTGRRRGIVPRKVILPLPVRHEDDVLAAFDAAINAKTRLIVIDQITSPTAMILPVGRIIELARERGIETIVDGAHAPGMIERPAGIAQAAAAWTGNLHKWPCALRGTAVITVREDLRSVLKPPVISHHLDQSFGAEFDWQGTHDPTPWILAPQAIGFMDRFGGWEAVRQRNRTLTIQAHQNLCERLGATPICPLDGSMTGFMATVRLPDRLQPGGGGPPLESSNAIPGPDGRPILTMDPIHRHLFERHRIEVPIVTHCDERFVRFSVHLYNTPDEYDALADAILELSAKGMR